MFWNREKRQERAAQKFVGRPLGRVLTLMGKVTADQVAEALTMQRSRGGKIGEILVTLGYITASDVEAALAAQRGEV
jgi:type IV pilus assembly protein PilB